MILYLKCCLIAAVILIIYKLFNDGKRVQLRFV